MRLINIWTLEFGEFFEKQIPKYFILSHRWGEDEVSYKDYAKKRKLEGPGYDKIVGACECAKRLSSLLAKPSLPMYLRAHAVDWIWIDTCCIDKRSTAELSEAINSMFTWYKKSILCIAYLSDVPRHDLNHIPTAAAFEGSSWFTRGWTLQELLAPRAVLFFNSTWKYIGHLCELSSCSLDECRYTKLAGLGPSLLRQISRITGIETDEIRDCGYKWPRLGGRSPCVAMLMSWASRRRTTRLEDEAYCLLGLLGVNMPLIYGEGRHAFRRLQEELIRRSRDQSIFAWREPPNARDMGAYGYYDDERPGSGLLAASPAYFSGCGNISCFGLDEDTILGSTPYTLTNNGLELLCTLEDTGDVCDRGAIRAAESLTASESRYLRRIFLLCLNCEDTDQSFIRIALIQNDASGLQFRRLLDSNYAKKYDTKKLPLTSSKRIYISTESTTWLHKLYDE